MWRERPASKYASDQGTKTQEYFVFFMFRVPIKAPALMGRGGAAEGEGSPAAAGGRGRQGCLSAAVEKRKEKRKPAAFFVSPQGVRLS